MPKRTRRYPTKYPTTTPMGKREYHRQYMRDYRKKQTEAIRKLRQELPDVYKMLFGTPKRKTRK